MKCPSCHAENDSAAAACAACGRSLSGSADQPARRSSSRRRKVSSPAEAAAVDTNNPVAWRAYRVSLWSVIPGLGLLLGPAAAVLGCRAVRSAGDDFSASNRARAAIVLGISSALTQWLGIALMFTQS